MRTKNKIPQSEVKFLPSELELDDFLFNNLNTTQGAFVLDYNLVNGTNVYNLTLQINQTDVYDQNLNKIEFVNYVQIPMQLSIEREIGMFNYFVNLCSTATPHGWPPGYG